MFARSEPEPDIPPLEAGDRLTREEFERRYRASPHIRKAELIEGVVYVASPVKIQHAESDFSLSGWLAYYRAMTPGVRGATNATVVLDDDNEPQPDQALRLVEGQSRLTDDGYVAGAPELVVEVANTSTSYDLHQKRHVYRRHGVREYIVLLVREGALKWFARAGGDLVERPPDDDGIYRSRVFPGLWLDAAAFLRGDLPRVYAVLQAGIEHPDHAAFVAQMQEK